MSKRDAKRPKTGGDLSSFPGPLSSVDRQSAASLKYSGSDSDSGENIHGSDSDSDETADDSSLDAFLNGFPKKPKGTLAPWAEAMQRVKTFWDCLSNEEDLKKISTILEPMKDWQTLKSYFGVLGEDNEGLVEWHNLMKELPDNGDACAGSWRDGACRFFSRWIFVPIEKRQENLRTVRNTLINLSSLSNNSEFATQTADLAVEEVSREQFEEMMEGVHIASPTKLQQEIATATNLSSDSDISPPWWPAKEPKVREELESFSQFWNQLVLTSIKVTVERTGHSGKFKLIKRDKKAHKKRDFKETIDSILRWEEHTVERTGCGQRGNRIKVRVFPDIFAAEKEAVQPILGSVIRALSGIHAREDTNNSRIDLRSERYMPAHTATGRSKRFIDFESTQVDRFSPVLLDQEMRLIKEVKNVRRRSRNARTLHQQVCAQVFGSLAKRTLIAFEIGNIGIDALSVGVVLTPVYMQVLSVQLENMGTDMADVKLQRTPLFPLVNEAAFDELVTGEDRNYLRPLLFPSNADSEDAR